MKPVVKRKRILICGPRTWLNPMAVLLVMCRLRKRYGRFTLVSGGANGVDKMTIAVANRWMWKVEIYEPDWRLGPVAGNLRNGQMLDTKPDLVVAIGYGKGTVDCTKQAKERGYIPEWHYPTSKTGFPTQEAIDHPTFPV